MNTFSYRTNYKIKNQVKNLKKPKEQYEERIVLYLLQEKNTVIMCVITSCKIATVLIVSYTNIILKMSSQDKKLYIYN